MHRFHEMVIEMVVAQLRKLSHCLKYHDGNIVIGMHNIWFGNMNDINQTPLLMQHATCTFRYLLRSLKIIVASMVAL